MEIEKKIRELGMTLPETPKPVAAYIPANKIGNWIYTSGQIPVVEGKLMYKGKLGNEVSIEDGYEAAKICALNAISAVKSVIFDLDNIEQIVKVTGFVNCTPDFVNQPQVINGASDLIKLIFEEKGDHARSAVGVSGLPLDASVEVEMIVKIKG